MSEPIFFREEEVKKLLGKLGGRWGKLWDESVEESKNALNNLGLLLIYLILDLKVNPNIKKHFEVLKSQTAKNIAISAFEVAQELVEE